MIYICVLNYKNPSDTVACLDSLRRLHEVDYHILLNDNASPDDSRDILESYAAKYPNLITFFPLNENRGYAAGNNVGLRYALKQPDMDYCWILNNDTVVEPDALSKLVEYMQSHPNVGLCGSKLMYEWNREKLQGYGGIYNYWLGIAKTCLDERKIHDIDYVIGAAVFVSRDFLKQIGLMCEDYFLYYEELDWAMRAKGKFRLGCCVDSIVYHKEGATTGSSSEKPDERTEFSEYWGFRNRLLFAKKYTPWCLPTIYLSSLGMFWHRLRRHQMNRIWMFLKLMLGIHDKEFEKVLY